MKYIKIFLLIVLLPIVVAAQDSESDEISLSKLEVNNAPSLLLFDNAPTTMNARNGGSAFTYSQFNGSNYAASVSPYWYLSTKNKNKSALGFAGIVQTNNNEGQEEYRMSPIAGLKLVTLSGAYVSSEISQFDATLNTVALGAQANILSIYPKGYAKKIVQRQEDIKNLLWDLNAYLISKYEKKLKNHFREVMFPEKEELSKLDRLKVKKKVADSIDFIKLNSFNDEKKMLEVEREKKYFISEITEKPIISLDGAVGYSLFFLNKDYDDRNSGRVGAWLTAVGSIPIGKDLGHENSKASYINFYVLGKYLQDQMTMNTNKEFVKQEFLDYGGKFEIELSRLSLGYEFIRRRSNISSTNSYRSSGILQFKVKDNVYLSTALGKSFGDEENLIALFGLNWNLQKQKQNISID